MTAGVRTRDAQRLWVAAGAAVFVVILPLANLSGFVSDYYLNLFGKYLALAVLALGLDLV